MSKDWPFELILALVWAFASYMDHDSWISTLSGAAFVLLFPTVILKIERFWKQKISKKNA